MKINDNIARHNYNRDMNMYEKEIFSRRPEGIRPGGLELTGYLVESCGFSAGARIVDAGCGTGISMDYISGKYGFDVTGIDLSRILLNKGHERSPGLRLINASGGCLPFRDHSVDGVLCECAMSAMHDKKGLLREINRILAEGGRLAVSDVYIRRPEYAGMVRYIPLKGCITGAMTYNELIKELADAGFRILLWEDRSDTWKSFIAKLIMDNGSLCEVLKCDSLSAEFSVPMLATAGKAKPGYYCMIAEKK